MKSRPTQFGVRENTASSRQHASRLAENSSSQELVRELKRPQNKDEARAPAEGDVEIIDLSLTDATNGATGEGREETVQSHPAVFSNLAQGHTAARSVPGNAPHAQSDGNFEPLLDVIEAARLLRIHPKTLRVKARRGIIPAVRIGRVWRFRVSTLNRWLERIAS
jgi:excisionase family DNA binding protein